MYTIPASTLVLPGTVQFEGIIAPISIWQKSLTMELWLIIAPAETIVPVPNCESVFTVVFASIMQPFLIIADSET